MQKHTCLANMAMLALSLALATGCVDSLGDAFDAAGTEMVFNLVDGDNDGALTREEWAEWDAWTESQFDEADANGDGSLDLDEFSAAEKAGAFEVSSQTEASSSGTESDPTEQSGSPSLLGGVDMGDPENYMEGSCVSYLLCLVDCETNTLEPDCDGGCDHIATHGAVVLGDGFTGCLASQCSSENRQDSNACYQTEVEAALGGGGNCADDYQKCVDNSLVANVGDASLTWVALYATSGLTYMPVTPEITAGATAYSVEVDLDMNVTVAGTTTAPIWAVYVNGEQADYGSGFDAMGQFIDGYGFESRDPIQITGDMDIEVRVTGLNSEMTYTISVASICTPDCEQKDCGDDGCGGVCGTCAGAGQCNATWGVCDSCAAPASSLVGGDCAGYLACVEACPIGGWPETDCVNKCFNDNMDGFFSLDELYDCDESCCSQCFQSDPFGSSSVDWACLEPCRAQMCAAALQYCE